ncbi:MAG: pantoate--beta-alanine ligase [Candidatus Omnitrophica bacterium]|nr:pantoate--beta-alanine ligase [Candidatus Omnitrophota bacterium]MBU4457731.1 pantoate--beta-alanine ligase [Candidatus Omnitrophota bacterium]
MRAYKGIRSLVKEIEATKRQGKTIGFVPTMGCLHDGHLSLIRKARRDADCVVVSIFVNPAQFGPNEDLKKYPRDIKRDLGLLRASGVDIVFAPGIKSLYPDKFSTYVDVGDLTSGLCGASRPGHFRGVATIVVKLFNIIKPGIAYFGQKDAQQAILIKKMVHDLNMDVKIKIMPIIREKDGLAMSSRNKYLSSQERKKALSLNRSLESAKDLYKKGERDSYKIIKKMQGMIPQNNGTKIDYIDVVDIEDLKSVKRISGKTLVALAVKVGKTRLIDNTILGG